MYLLPQLFEHWALSVPQEPTMSERLIPHKSLLYLFPSSQKAFLFSALTFQTSALQRDRLNVRQGDFTFISYFSIRSLCFHSPFFIIILLHVICGRQWQRWKCLPQACSKCTAERRHDSGRQINGVYPVSHELCFDIKIQSVTKANFTKYKIKLCNI